MDVQASGVRLHWREPQEVDKLRYRQSQEVQSQAREEGANSDGHDTSEALRHMMQSLAPPETFIALASQLHVHEARPDPRQSAAQGLPEPKRYAIWRSFGRQQVVLPCTGPPCLSNSPSTWSGGTAQETEIWRRIHLYHIALGRPKNSRKT